MVSVKLRRFASILFLCFCSPALLADWCAEDYSTARDLAEKNQKDLIVFSSDGRFAPCAWEVSDMFEKYVVVSYPLADKFLK